MVRSLSDVTPDVVYVSCSVDKLPGAVLTDKRSFAAVTAEVSVEVLLYRASFGAEHAGEVTNALMPDLVIFQTGELEKPFPTDCAAELQSIFKVIVNSLEVSYQSFLRPANCITVNTNNWRLCPVHRLNMTFELPHQGEIEITKVAGENLDGFRSRLSLGRCKLICHWIFTTELLFMSVHFVFIVETFSAVGTHERKRVRMCQLVNFELINCGKALIAHFTC